MHGFMGVHSVRQRLGDCVTRRCQYCEDAWPALYELGAVLFLVGFCVGQALEWGGQQLQQDGSRQHRQRQAHWRPGSLDGLVGHSKDGELSLCRVLILSVSTVLPGTPVDWLAAAPGSGWVFHAAR